MVYNGILLSYKNEWDIDTHSIYYVKNIYYGKKPDTKRQILYDSIFVKCSEMGKSM